MPANIDLSQLTVKRESAASTRRHPRHMLTRYVLPAVVLGGFLAVLLWAARDSLLPAKQVTVVPVLATKADVQQSGTPLFQSAGWVEPRPTPVVATALAEGVVDKLLVVEGQDVKAGEPVARLIDVDARLALQAAERELSLREAEADALLVKSEADLVFIPFQLAAAEAREQLARIDVENKIAAGSATSSIALSRAEAELKSATAAVGDLKVRKQRLIREVATLKQARNIYRGGSADQFEPAQPLTEQEAAIQIALARVRQAQTVVSIARLKLERMTVLAPSSGRVLALVARPGTRLMGLAWAPEASTVVTLYDPQWIQVRVDVRLDDVPRLQKGQPVRIETPAAPGAMEGELLFATAITDIQKNTLQVKVSIKSPPPTLRPDMLVTVTFLAPEPKDKTAASEQLRLFVPRQFVESGEAGTRVWVADQTGGRARLKSVKLGPGTLGDLVEVAEGLNAADKVIAGGREGLTDGQRINITGQELGSESTTPAAEPKSKAGAGRLPTGSGTKGK